jgi:polysaccharide deacetylase family protein (PEP-CTERM system associated)
MNVLSCELEDWFHILDSEVVPEIGQWSKLPLHAERNVDKLLRLFEDTGAKATFFCLGWMAERMPHVVRRCQEAGHEIASHGYGHIIAHRVGPASFREDITRSKKVIEDIAGQRVDGFRAPGFGVRNDNQWFFDTLAEAGYRYDASVFPAHHAHGGIRGANPKPHIIETKNGPLVEIPVSTVTLLGCRVCMFGGGYLRISPLFLIRWGARRVIRANQPLVVYVHPREVEPGHPRLPLPRWRKFKCYVNLQSTMPKLRWLCEHYSFTTAATLVKRLQQDLDERRPPAMPHTGQDKRPTVLAADVDRRQTLPPEPTQAR